MKAFALRLLAFCATAFAVLLLFAAFTPSELEGEWFARRTSEHDTYRRIPEYRQFAEQGAPELLILGPSTGYLGIDPAAFQARGHSTFNLASAMQTPEVSLALLNWSLGMGAKPDAVLLDVYPRVWSQSSLPSIKDLIVNRPDPLDGHFLRLAVRSEDPKTILNALYFHFRDRFQKPHDWPSQPHLYQLGHTHSRTEVSPIKYFNPKKPQLNDANREGFRQFRRTCEENGIQLILSMPPLPCKTEFTKPEAMKGLPWIAGSDWPLERVDTLYYDDHHLRGIGAELYSEWLAEQVSALLLAPNDPLLVSYPTQQTHPQFRSTANP